jgi:hypothetical protein
MLVEQVGKSEQEEIVPENPSVVPERVDAYQVVQNSSDEPIWDVTVYAPKLVEQSADSPWFNVYDEPTEIGFMAPHEIHKSVIRTLTVEGNRYPLLLEFRDNAGRSWVRDLGGNLEKRKGSLPGPSFGGLLWVRITKNRRVAE